MFFFFCVTFTKTNLKHYFVIFITHMYLQLFFCCCCFNASIEFGECSQARCQLEMDVVQPRSICCAQSTVSGPDACHSKLSFSNASFVGVARGTTQHSSMHFLHFYSKKNFSTKKKPPQNEKKCCFNQLMGTFFRKFLLFLCFELIVVVAVCKVCFFLCV